MSSNSILDFLCSSSLVLDNSSIFWLAKGGFLMDLFHEFLFLSRSIDLEEDSLESLFRKTESLLFSSSDSSYQKTYSLIQKLKSKASQFRLIKSNKTKYDEITDKLHSLVGEIEEESIIYILALISKLSEKSNPILLVTNNKYLIEAINILKEKGELRTGINSVDPYEIALFFFSVCLIDVIKFNKFHKDYFNENPELTKLNFMYIEQIKNRALIEYPDALIQKNHSSMNPNNLIEKIIKSKEENDIHDVFLCYNSLDKDIVNKIYRELLKRGINPYLDEQNEIPGVEWFEQIIQSIPGFKAAAIFLSKNNLGRVQEIEIKELLNRYYQEKFPLIPIIIDNYTYIESIHEELAKFHSIFLNNENIDPISNLILGICKTNKSQISRFKY